MFSKPYMDNTTKNKTPFNWQLLIIVFLTFLLIGVIVFFLVYNTHSITFVTSDGATTYKTLSLIPFELPAANDPERLTFLGWTDSRGNLEKRSEIRVYEDTVYTARYITALNRESHSPYLFLDAEGLLHPNDYLSRGDAALAIYSLLSGKIESSSAFYDVPPDSVYYEAVAQLKSLGILSGSRFYPEDNISWGELAEIIASFYPANTGLIAPEFVEQNHYSYNAFNTIVNYGWLDPTADIDPDGAITRSQAAIFLNSVLGRKPDSSLSISDTGSLPDCAPFDEIYLQLAEAAVQHDFAVNDTGNESWISSETNNIHYSGYVMVGGKLRYADENGLFTIGYNDQGFYFDESGCYSSGSNELDKLVCDVLSEITTADMTSLEKLRQAYDYVVQNCSYLRRNYYSIDEKGWEIEEATVMLSTHKGNCYSFAAAFWALARGLGYDAQAVSGIVAPGTPHGWVVIRIDEYDYIFDPELNYVNHIDRFMLEWSKYCPWGYSPEPEIK